MKAEVQMPARCKVKPDARELQRNSSLELKRKGSCGTQVKEAEVAVTERKRTRWNSTELINRTQQNLNRTGPGELQTHEKLLLLHNREKTLGEDCRQFNKHSERVRVS